MCKLKFLQCLEDKLGNKMPYESLKQNLNQIKEIVREMYVFTSQLEMIKNLETGGEVFINTKEKNLLTNSIVSLTNQLKILNNSIPQLVGRITLYKKLETGQRGPVGIQAPKLQGVEQKKLIQVKYKPKPEEEKISLTIDDKDRLTFLENLSRSNLSINQLKKKYAVEKPVSTFGKPSFYAKISNRFFRDFSNKLVAKDYFKSLNKNLRKMNSPFVVGTYVSMIFFTILISLIASMFLFVLLLFFKLGLTFPFLSITKESLLIRFFKVFWIVLVIPLFTGLFMYFYPLSEGKNLGSKIEQELPFVTIHMSAIATSGIEPLSIFKIILKSKEYKHTNLEFRKLMNLVNFHGLDIITALKKTAQSCSSVKLKELLNGFATTMTSGGNLHSFLDKHAETLLFDYKLGREKYTKSSETFMDIYISIAIAAPMILLMLFVIMGSTGTLTTFMGLNTEMLSFLIILAIVLLNVIFIIFLKLKQPVI